MYCANHGPRAAGRRVASAANLVCPHCQTKGKVRTRLATRKVGVSGGKAAGAVLTGGLSLLATGLSRKQKLTVASCGQCGVTWTIA